MPTQIGGTEYYTADEVAREAGVSRVTLWRWRQDGRVPSGHRLRGRAIGFTAAEVGAIKAFALRVEPITPAGAPRATGQLTLFDRHPSR